MKIISFFSTRDKIGKTTICANLAMHLSRQNFKILVIDLDPTAGLSIYTKLQVDKNNSVRLFDLEDETKVLKLIKKNAFYKADLISGGIDLASIKNSSDILKSETIFNKNISCFYHKYDLIFLDLSATYNELTKIAFKASNSVFLILECAQSILNAIPKLLALINKNKIESQNNLLIEGVLINKFSKKVPNSAWVFSEYEKLFRDKLYKTKVDYNLTLALPKQNTNISYKTRLEKFDLNIKDLTTEFLNKQKK